MSSYMQAAAMCSMAVVAKGPMKVDQRALLEKQLVGKSWKDIEEIVEKTGEEDQPIDDEKCSLEEGHVTELPSELPSELEASQATVERYQLVGKNRARAKEKNLGTQRDALRCKHREEEENLQTEFLEEEAKQLEEAEYRTTKKKQELEEFISQREFEKQSELRAQEDKKQAEEINKQRVHPVDILQRRIAMDLADEREAENYIMNYDNDLLIPRVSVSSCDAASGCFTSRGSATSDMLSALSTDEWRRSSFLSAVSEEASDAASRSGSLFAIDPLATHPDGLQNYFFTSLSTPAGQSNQAQSSPLSSPPFPPGVCQHGTPSASDSPLMLPVSPAVPPVVYQNVQGPHAVQATRSISVPNMSQLALQQTPPQYRQQHLLPIQTMMSPPQTLQQQPMQPQITEDGLKMIIPIPLMTGEGSDNESEDIIHRHSYLEGRPCCHNAWRLLKKVRKKSPLDPLRCLVCGKEWLTDLKNAHTKCLEFYNKTCTGRCKSLHIYRSGSSPSSDVPLAALPEGWEPSPSSQLKDISRGKPVPIILTRVLASTRDGCYTFSHYPERISGCKSKSCRQCG